MALMLALNFGTLSEGKSSVDTTECSITMSPVLTESQRPANIENGRIADSIYTYVGSPSFAGAMLIQTDSLAPRVIHRTGLYPQMSLKVEMRGGCNDWTVPVHLMEQEGWIALDTVGDTLRITNTYNPL